MLRWLVFKKVGLGRNIISKSTLLEFAFYIDGQGNRARPEFLIEWKGTPESFIFSYPYLLAFEPNFIEIRDIFTVNSYFLVWFPADGKLRRMLILLYSGRSCASDTRTKHQMPYFSPSLPIQAMFYIRHHDRPKKRLRSIHLPS